MPTLGEVVLGAFDLATEYARKRVRKEAGIIEDPRVTREDFEQAVIALRFDVMALTLAQADAAMDLHREHMRELAERWEAEAEAGNVPDVTLIEPTGNEPTHQPFKHALSDEEPTPRHGLRPPRKDDE